MSVEASRELQVNFDEKYLGVASAYIKAKQDTDQMFIFIRDTDSVDLLNEASERFGDNFRKLREEVAPFVKEKQKQPKKLEDARSDSKLHIYDQKTGKVYLAKAVPRVSAGRFGYRPEFGPDDEVPFEVWTRNPGLALRVSNAEIAALPRYIREKFEKLTDLSW